MENTMVSYLRDKFNPGAIILHGSRARHKARKNSDWDFILLFADPKANLQTGRELYHDQNIEFISATLPIDDVLSVFNTKLQQARVVFENNLEGTDLLERAKSLYLQGLHLDESKIAGHKLWLEGRISGMKDNLDNPLLFYKYFGDLYRKLFTYWYWLKRNQFSQPIYVAVEDMRAHDPDYLKLIDSFIAEPILEQKLIIAEKIKTVLFDKKRSGSSNDLILQRFSLK